MGLSRTDLEFLNDDARAAMLAPWLNNRAYVTVPSFTVGSNGTVYRSLRANGVDDDGNNIGPGAVNPVNTGATATWVEAFPQVDTTNFVPTSRAINTSGALSGGGNLTTNRTITVRTATTGQTGVVQLVTSTSSTSTTAAATPSAVNAVRITAEGRVAPSRNINTSAPITGGGNLSADRTIGISSASTSARGAVQLTTSTTSTSTALAATASAVRTVQNNANTRVPTSRTISTSAPITGGGDLTTNRTIGISTATTTARGAVQLSDSTTSTSTSLAPTIRSITSLRADVDGRVPTGRAINTTAPIRGGGNLSANRTISIDTATTARRGSVQLSTSVSSTSTTTAATSSAVRTADVNSRDASRINTGTLNLQRLPIHVRLFRFTSAGATQVYTPPSGARALQWTICAGAGGGGGGSTFGDTRAQGRGQDGSAGTNTTVSGVGSARAGRGGRGGGNSFASSQGGFRFDKTVFQSSGANFNDVFVWQNAGQDGTDGNGGAGGGTPWQDSDNGGGQEEEAFQVYDGQGGGGGGGGEDTGQGGGGGASGQFAVYLDTTPNSSYNIVVGAGGAFGIGGAGAGGDPLLGGNGSNGGNGFVLVEAL